MNDLVITYDKIVDTKETASVNSNDKTNYWVLFVVSSAIVCLML